MRKSEDLLGVWRSSRAGGPNHGCTIGDREVILCDAFLEFVMVRDARGRARRIGRNSFQQWIRRHGAYKLGTPQEAAAMKNGGMPWQVLLAEVREHFADGEGTMVGVDPDLRNTAVAAVDLRTGSLEYVGCTNVGKHIYGQQCAISTYLGVQAMGLAFRRPLIGVEGQRIRGATRGSKKIDPQSIVDLAACAGAAGAAVYQTLSRSATPELAVVEPMTWAGTTDKMIRHRRLCRDLGWECRETKSYVYPVFEGGTPPCRGNVTSNAHWKHVLDAIGIARWLAREVRMDAEIQRRGQ